MLAVVSSPARSIVIALAAAHLIARSAGMLIESRRARLESLASRTVLRKPHELVRDRYRLLDELEARATRSVRGRITLDRAKVSAAAAGLSALSPLDVLSRGYSVTLDQTGEAVSDVNKLASGDVITTRLDNGTVDSIVRSVSHESDDPLN